MISELVSWDNLCSKISKPRTNAALFKLQNKIKMKPKKILYAVVIFLVSLIFFILIFRNWDILKSLIFGS